MIPIIKQSFIDAIEMDEFFEKLVYPGYIKKFELCASKNKNTIL
jgi:hypothetical protein